MAGVLKRYGDWIAVAALLAGYGIVWNIGEHPVDGATDFLFTVASAFLIKLGVPIGRSVRTIGFSSHILTVLLVYGFNRRIWKAGIFIAFVTALYLAVGTGLSYVAAFFGTPFFALLATITWSLALLSIQAERVSLPLALSFALAGLLTGLTRPEGVILAGLMMVSIVVLKSWRASGRILIVFLLVFGVLGGMYFLWRWNYFGYPLPNPFYKKGAGILHWGSLSESLTNLVRFGGPFLLAFVLAVRSRVTTRQMFAFLIPLIGFAVAFILISNETNFGGRFQYALWPIILLSWYPLVAGFVAELRLGDPGAANPRTRLACSLLALALAYGAIWYSSSQNCYLITGQLSCGAAYTADGRYDVGKLLSQYQGKGYVIATSEAGLLPFYSNWTAIDTWGLNDEWIAHNGPITEQYLDQYKPDVIVFHAYFSPVVPPRLTKKNLSQDWFRMTITLMEYAQKHGYVLAAAFGESPYEVHYYYVRPDFPDSKQIAARISTMAGYTWYLTGKKSINYASIIP